MLTGVLAGQDGSYLAEFLLDKGYTVHGIIRRSSSFNTGRISHLYDDPRSHRQVEVLELQTKISQSRRSSFEALRDSVLQV